jgi:hypothetical protein
MVNQEVIDWIRTGKAKGYSQEQLSAYLSQQGYSLHEIDEAFNPPISKSISAPITPLTVQSPAKSSNRRIYIIALVIILLIVVAGVAIFFVIKNNGLEYASDKLSSFFSPQESGNILNSENPEQTGAGTESAPEEQMQTYTE